VTEHLTGTLGAVHRVTTATTPDAVSTVRPAARHRRTCTTPASCEVVPGWVAPATRSGAADDAAADDCHAGPAAPRYGDIPVSVLDVGRRSLVTQRRGRYVAGSRAHPDRMAPDLARDLILDYTAPGGLVFDPFAGTGTSLVEAAYLGRCSTGIEIERDWVSIARDNLRRARLLGASGAARIVHGNAARPSAALAARLAGSVNLVLAAPPRTRRIALATARPTPSPGRRRLVEHRILADWNIGIFAVLDQCRRLLRPDGLIVLVTRPWWRDGQLHDLTSPILHTASRAGLHLADRRIATDALPRSEPAITHAATAPSPRAFDPAGHRPSAVRHSDVLILSTRSTDR
jgi:modification methylase